MSDNIELIKMMLNDYDSNSSLRRIPFLFHSCVITIITLKINIIILWVVIFQEIKRLISIVLKSR